MLMRKACLNTVFAKEVQKPCKKKDLSRLYLKLSNCDIHKMSKQSQATDQHTHKKNMYEMYIQLIHLNFISVYRTEK